MAPGGAFFVMALFMVFHRKSTKADYPDTDDNDTFMYYHRHGKDIFAILRSIAEFLSLLLLVQGIEPNPGPLAYGSESSIDVDLRKKKTKPGTIPFNKGEITSLNDEEQTSTTYVDSALSASRRGTRSGPSLDDDFCSYSSTESTDCDTDDTERTHTDVSNSVVKSHKYKKKRAKRVSGGPQTRPSMDDKLCSYSSTDSDSDDLVKYRKEKVQLAWSTSHSEKTSSQSDIKVSEEIDNESESDSTVSTACSKDGQVKQTSNVKVPKFTNYDVKDYARTDDDMDCYTDLEYDDDYKVVFSPSYEKLNSGKEKNTSTSNKLVPEKDNNGNSNGNIKTKDIQGVNNKDEHNASVKPQSDIKEVTGEVNDGKNTGCESAKVTEKTRSRTNVDTKDLKSDSGSTSCSTYSQNVRKSVSKTPLQKAEEVNDKSDWSYNSHPTSCSTCPQNRPTSHPSSCSTCPQNRPASHPSSCSTCPKNRPASHPSSCSTCPTNRKAKTSGNKGKDISTRSSSLDNMTPSKRGVANKDESDWSSNSHPSSCPPNRRAVSNGIRSTSLSDKILSQTNADKSDLGSASPPTSNSTSTQSRHALANIKLVADISISTNKSTHVQNEVNVATNYCENINVVDLENKSRKSIDSLLDDNEISCQDKSRKSASFVSVKDDAKTSSSTGSKEFKFVEDIRSLRSLEIKTLSQHDEAIKDESDWDSDTESSFKSHSKHGSKSVVDNEMTIDAMNKSDITNNKSNDADIEKAKTSYKTNLEPVASCESVKSDIKSSEIETPKIIDNIRSLRSLSFAQEDCLSNNDQKARSNIISPALPEDNGNEEAAGRNSDANNCSPSSSFDIDKNIVKIDEDDISMLFRRGAHAIPLTKDPSTMDDDFCCNTSSSGGSKSENVKVLDQNDKFKASRSNMSAGDIANGGNINVEDVKRPWKDGVKELTGVNMKTTEMCGDALNFNVETNDVQEAVVNKTDDNGKPCRSVSLDANLCSRNDKKINSKFISSDEGVSKFSNYDVKDYADTDDDMDCYTDLEYDDDYKVTISPSFEKLSDEKKTNSTCNNIDQRKFNTEKSNDKVSHNVKCVNEEFECKLSAKHQPDDNESVKGYPKEEIKDEQFDKKSTSQDCGSNKIDDILPIDGHVETDHRAITEQSIVSKSVSAEHTDRAKAILKKVSFAKSAAVRNYDSQISGYKDEKDDIPSLSDSIVDNAHMSDKSSNVSYPSLALNDREDCSQKSTSLSKKPDESLRSINEVVKPIARRKSFFLTLDEEYEVEFSSSSVDTNSSSQKPASVSEKSDENKQSQSLNEIVHPIARQKSFAHTFDEEFEVESSSSVDTNRGSQTAAPLSEKHDESIRSKDEDLQPIARQKSFFLTLDEEFEVHDCSNQKAALLNENPDGSTNRIDEDVQPIARQKSFAHKFDEEFEVKSSSSADTNRSNQTAASLCENHGESIHSINEVVEPITRQKSFFLTLDEEFEVGSNGSSVDTNRSSHTAASLSEKHGESIRSINEIGQPIARQKPFVHTFDEEIEVESSSSVDTNRSNRTTASFNEKHDQGIGRINVIVQPIARQKSFTHTFDEEFEDKSSSSIDINRTSQTAPSFNEKHDHSIGSKNEIVQPIARQKSFTHTFDEDFEVKSSSSVDTNCSSLKVESLSEKHDESIGGINEIVQPIARQKPFVHMFNEEIEVESSSSVDTNRSSQTAASLSEKHDESIGGKNEIVLPIARQKSFAHTFDEEIEVESSSSVDTNRSNQTAASLSENRGEGTRSINEIVQPIARQKSFAHTFDEEFEVKSSSSVDTNRSSQKVESLSEKHDESIGGVNEAVQPIARQKSFAHMFHEEIEVESNCSVDTNRSSQTAASLSEKHDESIGGKNEIVLPIARQKSFAHTFDEEIEVESSSSVDTNRSNQTAASLSENRGEGTRSINEIVQPIARQKSFAHTFDEEFEVKSSSSVDTNRSSQKVESLSEKHDESIGGVNEAVQPIARQKSFAHMFHEEIEVESNCSVDTNRSSQTAASLSEKHDESIRSINEILQPIARQKSFAHTFDEAIEVESSSSVDTNRSNQTAVSLSEKQGEGIRSINEIVQPIARQKSFAHTFDEEFEVKSSSSVDTSRSRQKVESLSEKHDESIGGVNEAVQPIARQKSFAHMFNEEIEVESNCSVDTNRSSQTAASLSEKHDESIRSINEILVPIARQKSFAHTFDEAIEVESSSSVDTNRSNHTAASLSEKQGEGIRRINEIVQPIARQKSFAHTFDEEFEVKSSSSVDTNRSSQKVEPLSEKHDESIGGINESLQPIARQKTFAHMFDEEIEVKSSSSEDTNRSNQTAASLSEKRSEGIRNINEIVQPIARQKSFAHTFDEEFEVESSGSVVTNCSSQKAASLSEKYDGRKQSENVNEIVQTIDIPLNENSETFVELEVKSSSSPPTLDEQYDLSKQLHIHDENVIQNASFAQKCDEVFIVASNSFVKSTCKSDINNFIEKPIINDSKACVTTFDEKFEETISCTDTKRSSRSSLSEQRGERMQSQSSNEIARQIVNPPKTSAQTFDEAFEVESSSSVDSTSKCQQSSSLSKQRSESKRSDHNIVISQSIVNHPKACTDTFDEAFEIKSSSSVESTSQSQKSASLSGDILVSSSHSVEKPESFAQAIDKSGLDDVESCISVASTSYSLRPTSLHIKYDDIVFESISTYPNRITTTFQDLSEVSSCYDGTVVNSTVAIQKVKDVSDVAIQVDKVKYTLVSNKKTQVEDICDKHFVDKGVQYDLNESSRIHVTKNKLVQVDKFFKKETVDKEIQYEQNYTNTFKDHETQVEDLCKKEVHDMTTQVDKIVVCNQGIQVQNKPTEDKGIQFKSIFVNDANIKQNKEVQVDTIYKRRIEEKGTQYEPIHSYWAKLSMDKETQVENIDRKMVEDKFVQAETNVTNVPKTYDANIVAEEYCDNTSQNKKIQAENVNERDVENKRRGVKRSRSKRKVTYYSDEDPPVKDTFNKGIQVEDTRCKEVHEKRNRGEDLINGNSCTINIQNMVIHMNQIQAEATVDKTTDRGVNCVKEMDIETNKCRSIMPYPPSPTLKVYSISSPVVQNSRKRKLLTDKQQKKNETKSNFSTVNESGYEQQAMATSATIIEAPSERTNYWPLASTTEPQMNENRVNRKRKWQNGTRKSDKQSVKSTQSTSDVTNSRSIIEPCTAYRESSRTRKSKETIAARKEVKPKVKKTVAFQEPDNQQSIISTLCQSKSERLLVESCQGDETLLSNKSEGFIKNIVQLIGKEIDEALEKKMNRLDSVHIKNNHNRSPVNDKTTRVHDPYADMKPEYLSMFGNNKCEDKTVEKENIGNKKETIKDVKIENEKNKKKKSGFIGFLRRLFKK